MENYTKMNKNGRPLNSIYDTLGFQLCKNNRKYAAQCLLCNRVLCNTAASRLKQHRNSCKGVSKSVPSEKQPLKTEVSETTEITAVSNDEDYGFPYKIETYPDPLFFNEKNTDIEPLREESLMEPPAKMQKILNTNEEEAQPSNKSIKYLMSEITKIKAQMNSYIRLHEGEDEMLMKVMVQKMNRLPLPTKIRMQEKFLQDVNNELLRIENEKFP